MREDFQVMRNDFFRNNVTTTLTSSETIQVRTGDLVQVYLYSPNDTTTPTATTDTRVVYRVKTHTAYSMDVTPVNQAQVDSWFPTRWEINREAAIKGGRAQQKQHSRVPKKALVLRSSYQGMARLPCYRGTRPR
jgi:hypothetical protein